MDEIRPRRRRPAPAPPEPAQPIPPEQDQAFREMVALGEEIQGDEPAPPPRETVLGQVASRLERDGPAPAQPAPSRVCSFCCTRQPLSALREVADSLQCADQDACAQRAAQSGIYPSREDEALISSHEARQGALT